MFCQVVKCFAYDVGTCDPDFSTKSCWTEDTEHTFNLPCHCISDAFTPYVDTYLCMEKGFVGPRFRHWVDRHGSNYRKHIAWHGCLHMCAVYVVPVSSGSGRILACLCDVCDANQAAYGGTYIPTSPYHTHGVTGQPRVEIYGHPDVLGCGREGCFDCHLCSKLPDDEEEHLRGVLAELGPPNPQLRPC